MTLKSTSSDEFLYVTLTDTYGGQILNVMHTEHVRDLLKWIDNFRTGEIHERMLRESNPEVKLAYDAYKMAVAMHT